MAWTLTTSLAALRRDLNAAFPNRDRSSDGTIGDAAHQASTSGHNPDDTSGSKSEYTDADGKQEVRAYDADNDLRDPRGTDFQQVIDRILATPADRERLAYIIHRRKIWRKRNGWRREDYTGSSPHTEHAHFSGDPAQDENGAPWSSVLSFKAGGAAAADAAGGTMPTYSTANPNAGENVEAQISALLKLEPVKVGSLAPGNVKGMVGEAYPMPNALAAKLAEILVAAQAGGGQVTPTPEQWAALTASITATIETLFAEKVGQAAELAAEAAIRKVLGGLDGAVPPPPPAG